jgi:hypothetical protein
VEAVSAGVAMVVAVAVVVLTQQFLVVFRVESGPDVPLHCMLPQTQVLSFLQ